MRQIERYVRASVEICSQSVDCGNGVRMDGGDIVGSVELGFACEKQSGLRAELRETLRTLATAAIVKLRPNGGPFDEMQADRLTDMLEDVLVTTGEPWFVEIWDAHEALTQVYSPFGMPRNT